MDFLQLPDDELLHLSDEDLGQYLITSWLEYQAARAGIARNAIPREWATQIVERTGQMDSGLMATAALESMFRKTCAGDVASAGRMLRIYLPSRAGEIVKAKYAAVGIEHAKGRKRASKKAAATRQVAASAAHANWVAAAQDLLKMRRQAHELSAILAKRFNVSPKHMRTELQKAGLVKKREVK